MNYGTFKIVVLEFDSAGALGMAVVHQEGE